MTLCCPSCRNRIVITVPKDCEHRVQAWCCTKHLKPQRMVLAPVVSLTTTTNPRTSIR